MHVDTRKLSTLMGFVIVLAGAAGAASAADDFDRRGWYLGAGVAAQYYLLTDDVESNTNELLTVSDTVGFNVRGGYRAFSWLAAEVIYEYAPGFVLETKQPIDLSTIEPGLPTVPKGTELLELNGHTVTANAKLLLPIWRVQPYLNLGVGVSYITLDDKYGLVGGSEAAIAGRIGVGGDIYITKHLLLFLEVSGLLTSFDLANPTATDNLSLLYYLSPQGGLQWRF